MTSTEWEDLGRIATALERIALCLERKVAASQPSPDDSKRVSKGPEDMTFRWTRVLGRLEAKLRSLSSVPGERQRLDNMSRRVLRVILPDWFEDVPRLTHEEWMIAIRDFDPLAFDWRSVHLTPTQRELIERCLAAKQGNVAE